MFFPLSILVGAIAAMAFVAFGADPAWMAHSHGLQLIMLSRRLQWPLVALVIMGCAALCAMVIAGRWRAWWLIGLAPVLALFVHRFVIDPTHSLQVDADAVFLAPDQAKFVADNDYVVGLTFDGDAYAYPYNILYETPIVAQAKPRHRLLLIWSAFANRAVATETDWGLKPRELEIVSEPANALLVYNSRLGEFINGVTGLTPAGDHPTGFGAEVSTVKMPWKTWKTLHPRTLVLQPPQGWRVGAPTQPVLPRYPMPLPGQAVADSANDPVVPVALIESPRPTLVNEAAVTGSPLNMMAGANPILLFRGGDDAIKVFIRQANGDLTPRFFPIVATAHGSAVWTELDSNSSWTADGRAVDGPLKGEKLKPVEVDDQVYLNVIRYWFPDAALIVPRPSDVGKAPLPPAKPARASRRRRTAPAAHRPTRPRRVAMTAAEIRPAS